ncbi:MAG: peptidyl-prolyl cis-trans isomerase [Candidatus Kerfeldbacteria bacterium]|nr:peptidyl-prolyl cis-trans isomerase [Candidatus Kerfeldbacteria bacterium]
MVSTLTRLYEWTPDQFKQKVLRPYLLRSKLETAIGKDQSLNADAKTEADSVLAKINAGEITFEDAAKQYSDDVTASSGGDLGFFSTGQMVSEFETAAFALQPGETSGVVQTQFGYHIIRVTERVAATDDAPEQVRASHILFKGVDLDTYTNQQLAEASIAIFPKGLEWKDDCGLVLGVEETCEQNELLDVAQQTSTPTDSQTQPAE